jgi:hypothetical protein
MGCRLWRAEWSTPRSLFASAAAEPATTQIPGTVRIRKTIEARDGAVVWGTQQREEHIRNPFCFMWL